MQNQCNLNVRSKCILNALRIRKGTAQSIQYYAFSNELVHRKHAKSIIDKVDFYL